MSRLLLLSRQPPRVMIMMTRNSNTLSSKFGGGNQRNFNLSVPVLRNRWLTSTTSAGHSTPQQSSLTQPFSQPQSPLPQTSQQESRKDIGKLLSFARPEAATLTGAISLLLVSSGVTMAVPFTVGQIIDVVIANSGSALGVTNSSLFASISLPWMFSGLVVFFAVGGLANFGRIILLRLASERIVMRLRMRLFESMIRQDIAFFDSNRTGELISRLSSDTVVVSKSLTSNVSDGLRGLVSCLVGVGMMAYANLHLTLILMSIVPPLGLAAVWYGRRVRSLTKQTQDAIGETTKVAEERLGNMRTVRAFSGETSEIMRYQHKVDEVFGLSMKEGYASGYFFGGTGFAGNLLILAILYYGGSLVQTGAITTGELTSFFLYTGYVLMSFFGLSTSYSELMKGLGASSRLFSLLDTTPKIEKQEGINLQNVDGTIEFRNISFAYPTRQEVSIFKDLSFTVKKGTHVAVVGPSGSGKSTIAQLLLRFYDPERGAVFVDGHDLRSLDPHSVRQNLIAFVPQEPMLFAATIRENIAYGKPDATEDQVVEAADIANARGFIEGFPAGFETYVGEKGVALSGGQKQRIAIARALIKNPRILVLDEATSALDAASESIVQDAIGKAILGRTVITIAHRLSTIQQADYVVMIDKGYVVETGTFEELIEKPDGRFRNLVESQL